ncbi:MAG: DUF2807 domain-containing protein [Candidatus Pedobacter colombiensis]|uniref:DUF2807 domain-containing protein n=1 Tax=Candidatus Pedobacter colombiensis TaxID=3121371 RepID=A0AAJ6B608_9SPHI|nr:head GIN domain-containing protein [Pedobacter sp.]WEK18046.1 MAG: DUF2807 domain-containing protein [Pedobacter sp.]
MKSLVTILLGSLLFSQANGIHAALPSTINKTVQTSDEREVKNFTGVVAGGPIEVIIKLGDKESLRFEGDKEAIATLVGEVKSNILIIRPQNSWTSWARKYENKKIIAYVTAKQISSLTMSGNGSITVSGTIKAAEFATTLSGSGTIKANIEADKITGVISGSGTANITGKADVASVTLSGPGTFGNKTLSVNELSARISGKGTINITAHTKIKAFISGSGHIYYSGDAEVKETTLGAGGVSKK